MDPHASSASEQALSTASRKAASAALFFGASPLGPDAGGTSFGAVAGVEASLQFGLRSAKPDCVHETRVPLLLPDLFRQKTSSRRSLPFELRRTMPFSRRRSWTNSANSSSQHRTRRIRLFRHLLFVPPLDDAWRYAAISATCPASRPIGHKADMMALAWALVTCSTPITTQGRRERPSGGSGGCRSPSWNGR